MSTIIPPPSLHALAAACMFREETGCTEEQILAGLGVTIEEAQRACGQLGHEYETYDKGDASTPFYASYRCCMFCGAPDEGGYDDEW